MLLYQNHNELTVLLLSDWCLKRHSSTISKIPILEPKILQVTLLSENSVFIVSKLVVGSGDQDLYVS